MCKHQKTLNCNVMSDLSFLKENSVGYEEMNE